MNANCYKVIFSKRLGALVAVGEHATSSGKAASGQASRGVASPSSCATIAWGGFVGALRFSFASVALACLSLGSTQAQSIRPPLASNALPTGASINAGSASISTSGAQMAITQSTDKTSINWNSFNIGSGASVNIAQPSSSSVLLNRVVGQDPSQIFGKLSANGQVILLNPNGIAFGRDGSVTATSFTASTFNLTDADFMSGFYKYNRNGSTASIVNEGTIETSAGGFVALIGASVTNDGKIIAPQGNVVLAAAESVALPDAVTATQSSPASTVSVPLSKKVRLELLPATINTAITNTPSGVIVTDGGQVLLQAAAISTAVASITHSGSIDTSGNQGGAVQVLAENGNIKVNGSITANSTGSDNNNQTLKGGDIIIGRDEQTGALAKATDVSGARLESTKGFVETSGDFLKVDFARIQASEWLLDPTNITIAASGASGTAYASTYTAAADSVILASDINASLNLGTSVTLSTSATGGSAGNIAVNESISKTAGGNAALRLNAHGDISIAAGKSISSSMGKLDVTLVSDYGTSASGAIVMNTGSAINSYGGNIKFAGSSSGTSWARGNATNPFGITLSGASISAAGGDVTMYGMTDTFGSSVGHGVGITNSSVSTTGAGSISIQGYTNSSVALSSGVAVLGSTITGGSIGSTFIAGTNASTGNQNRSQGVWLDASSGLSSTITSSGGSVYVTGTGGGASTSQYNYGVSLTDGIISSGGTGSVSVTGTGGGGSGGSNAGVVFNGPNSPSISSSGGTITVTGTGGPSSSQGIWFVTGYSGSIQSGNNAAITLTTDSLVMDQGSINAGTGTVTIQNKTAGTVINVGGADVLSGGTLTLGVSNAELNRITAGTTKIGRSNSGALTVNSAISTALSTGNLYLYSGNTATATASVSSASGLFIQTTGGGISNASGATLSGANVTLDNTNGTINATTGAITQGAATGSTGVAAISVNDNITATGNLNMYGLSTNNNGIYINSGKTISGGNIQAIGNSGTGNPNGLYINYGSITTTGTTGSSLVKGISATTGTGGGSAAAQLVGGNYTAASGTTLTVEGLATGSAGANFAYTRGLRVNDLINTYGDITLKGSSSSDDGVLVQTGGINVRSGSLTLNGTITANGGASQSGVTVAQPIKLYNGTTLSIIGRAANTNSAITNADNGVQIGAAISQASGQTTAGDISITGSSSSYANSNGVNIYAAISTGTGNIKIVGQNLAGGNGFAVNDSSALGSTSSNVTIQGIGSNISLSGAITGKNVTIDNTGAGLNSLFADTTYQGAWAGSFALTSGQSMGGSIDATTGAITAGTGVRTSGTAVNLISNITASGNINIQGNAISNSVTGVSVASSSSLVSSGAAASINVGTNYSITHNGSIKTTNNTGTSTTIGLTATSGGITGAGTIGDATNKNASVAMTTGATSTFDGAINAKDLIKAGIGALTLDSWAYTTPALTNVSNSYTINAGTLNLSTGNSYNTINPSYIYINNGSTFGGVTGNAGWSGTNFTFDANGGGTINWSGNPIMNTGATPITFTTNGGATNNIVGGFNMAYGTGLTFNIAAASTSTNPGLLLSGSSPGYAGFVNTASTAVTKTGVGLLRVNNTFSAPTLNINQGTWEFGDGSTSAGATTLATGVSVMNISVASGAKLSYNTPSAQIMDSTSTSFTGAGTILKKGAGTVRWNTTAGTFALGAGSLIDVQAGTFIGGSNSNEVWTNNMSSLNIATGATFDGSEANVIVDALTGSGSLKTGWNSTGGSITVGANGTAAGSINNATGTAYNTAGTATFSGLISTSVGSTLGSLTKYGSGTQILTGPNTYAGTTTINAGTLQIGDAGTTGSPGSGAVSIASGATLTFHRSNTVTLANAISSISAGAGTINYNGTNSLSNAGQSIYIITGNNSSFSGNINVSASRLQVTNPNNLGTASIAVNGDFGQLYLNGGSTYNNSLSLNGTGWVDSYAGPGQIGALRLTAATYAGNITLASDTRIGSYASAGVISGVISGASNAGLSINGTVAGYLGGTVTLANANTFSGTTTINSGTLQIGNGGATGSLGSGNVVDNAALVFNRDASANLTISNAISGSGTVAQSGAGRTILTGSNSYSGTTSINSGTLQIGDGGTTGTLGTAAVVDNGTLTFNRSDAISITNAISGTGAVAQSGSGTTTLSGNNTYVGSTNVTAGILKAGSLTAFGNADLVSVSSGATVDVAGFALTNPFSLAGTGVSSNGALINTGAADTLTGNVTLTGDTTIGGTGDLTLSGVVSGAFGLAVVDSGSFAAINTSNNISKIASNGGASLSFLNNAELEVGTVNSINGINNSGQVDISTASGDLVVSQNVTTSSTSTSAIVFNAGQTATAGISTGGNIVLSGIRTFNTGANGRATLMTGSIAGSTGMSTLLNALGHSRYNSDEAASNYSTALGSGTYGIYREQPIANITINSDTKIYDTNAYTGGNGITVSNLKNGDLNAGLTGVLTYGGTAQNARNAGSYTLTGSGQTSNLGYAVTYIDGALTITPKTLTLTAANISKEYDGSLNYATQASDLAALSTQLLSGDTVTAATISYANKNAATGSKVVTLDAVTISDGNNGANYTVTRAGNSTSTIAPKALTLTAASVSKEYDGGLTYTTQASDLNALSNQLPSGDSVTAATISFANKNVASGSKVVTLDAATINDGNSGANYIITRAGNSTSTITPKALTLTAANVSKDYDGGLTYNTQASDLTALSNQLFTGDSVTSATISYVDKNAALGSKVVTLDAASINDGNNGANYVITRSGNSTSTINKVNLIASLQGTVSKEYDNSTTATLTGSNFSFSGWASGEGATVTQTLGAYASPNVSANNGGGLVSAALNSGHFVAASNTDLNNYTLPTTISGNVGLITPVALTIKVNDTAAFVTQDARQASDMGFSFTGLKGADSASTVLTGGALTSANRSYTDPTGTVVANHPTAGSYTGIFGLTTTPSAANGNYTITVQKGDLLVAPADKLLITVSSASDTYGNRTAADAGQANTVSAHYCLDANVACTGANYAALTLTQQAGNQWKASDSTGQYVVFDTTLNSATFSQGGYLNAGTYRYNTTQINPLSLPNGNFNGRVTNGGVLTINRLTLSPTGSSTSKIYDGSAGVSGVTISPTGSMTGDDVGMTSSVGSFASKDVGNNIAVTMSGLSITGADATNYTLSGYSLITTGSITAKALNISDATVVTKEYDATTSATLSSNGSLTGLVGNETLTLSGLTASYANANAGLGKTVGLSATLANGSNGGLATNYSLLNASTTGDITPKLLTLSGTTVGNKIYDGSTKASITALGSLSGFVGSETVLLSGVSGTFATASAGSNVAVTLQANLQDGTNGGLASNYSVSTSTAYANITPVNNAIIRPPVVPTSSSSSSGNGSGGKSGSSPNPYLALPMEPASAERCTPNNLESCQCDTQGGDGEVAICYEPQKSAQTTATKKSSRS